MTHLDTYYDRSDYDLSHNGFMAAAIADGWTAAGADALASEEMAALEDRWAQESASEIAAEAANEMYFEDRPDYDCPEWAR